MAKRAKKVAVPLTVEEIKASKISSATDEISRLNEALALIGADTPEKLEANRARLLEIAAGADDPNVLALVEHWHTVARNVRTVLAISISKHEATIATLSK